MKSAKQNPILLLVTAILLSCVLEVIFFNFSYVSQFFKKYERQEIDLSACAGYNGDALPLLPENPSISFDRLKLPTRSVTVHTSGPFGVLAGNIGICDEANAYKTAGAGTFLVNPGGEESSFTVRLNSRGGLTRLRISFEELSEPVFLTSVVLNERLPFDFSLLRAGVMVLFFFVLFASLRYRLYAQIYEPERRSHRLLNLAVLGFCLLASLGVLYAGDASHTLLHPYPTLEKVRSPEMVVDAYMQQLDAFEKGQTELDLDVNPALEALDNPYDKGERDKKEVTYHWDRAYYNGKYYSYFGLAPLFTVYYPVYRLTGSLPTEALAASLLALFAVLTIFAAIRALYRTFRPRANLLLLLLGEAAVAAGSFLYLMQSSQSFYYLPLLSAVGWLAAFTACSYEACLAEKLWKRMLLFALSGLSFVLLVLSRPNSALLAVALVLPLFLRVLLHKSSSWKQKLSSALPFLIPVVIGAVAVMYYNQIRFGSPFEFGTSYQLTESDIRYNRFTLNVHYFASMLYHYFLEPFVHTEFFPFLRFTTEKCVDFGNYLYQEYSAGLFTMPLNLGVFLLGFTLHRRNHMPASSSGNTLTLQKQTYVLLLLAILELGYLDFLMGGIHIRYVCDLSLALSLLAFLLIIEHIHYEDTKSSHILYVLAVLLLLSTIGKGLLLSFSNETNDVLMRNPDLYIRMTNLFRI